MASPFEEPRDWRQAVIGVANAVAVVLVAPLGLLANAEQLVSPDSEVFHLFGAQVMAGVPGFPGVLLRRAYYWWALEHCSLRCVIGYGAYFSHRMARVDDHAYIGAYAVVGSADIGAWALIGTRASLLSGGNLHVLDDEGRWLPSNLDRLVRIRVGSHAWVGEGAIVMADIGQRAMVAAGAVVSAPVADSVMVAGNPARFVRHLAPPAVEEPA